MTNRDQDQNGDQQKFLFYRNGKIYFSKNTERNFFFVMTALMLVLGILAKMDFF
jgi:hypothetical protein